MAKGLFITFEGIEGSGKSTQVALLRDRLAASGREVIATRSPGGTPAAERMRSILKERDHSETLSPEAELMLFGACHAQMSKWLIVPALDRGATILCDRFFDSTTAYQGYARGLPLERVESVNRLSCGDLKPDITILLDMEPETLSARLQGRGGGDADRFDSEPYAFHKAVRDGFLSIAAKEPRRFRLVNADAPPEKVHNEILRSLSGELGVI